MIPGDRDLLLQLIDHPCGRQSLVRAIVLFSIMAKHVQPEAVGRTRDSPAISITAIVLLFLITTLNQMCRRVGLLRRNVRSKV